MAALIPDYKYTGHQVPMEEIRVLSLTCGTRIPAIRSDTFKIFTPGLVENIEHIKSISPHTTSYGSHPRHKVDIYDCAETRTGRGTGPILVFFYGGGMTRGERTIDAVPKGLVYNNLGTYFAGRGITTLAPDYRRVDSKRGGEGATYPSGGEDLALLLKWLQGSELLANGHRDVYLLGNSVGATHVATFLLEKQFLEQRQEYVNGSKGYLQGVLETVGVRRGLTLKGAILLGMPSHFAEVSKDRQDHFKAYWGSADRAAELCPLGLLSFLPANSTPSSLAIPHILALVGEYDPPDEVVHPTKDFVQKFQSLFPDQSIDFKILKGHNHVSPIAALMSGDVTGERWGAELATWIVGNGLIVDESVREILRGPKKKRAGSDMDRLEGGSVVGLESDKTKHDEKLDLNREDAQGAHGKGEKEPKEIQPREHFTTKDNAS